MKKQVLAVLFFLLIGVSLNGQNPVRTDYRTSTSESYKFPRNEIRANLLMSVIGLLTFDYEYFVEDNFGIGLTGSYSMLEKNDSYLRGLLLPYGRLYFSNGLNDGFFIEGNTGLVISNRRNYEGYSEPSVIDNDYNFGIGVGVGYKILTRNNWVGELQLGVGRIFGENNLEVYPRVGVSIGKRF